jgi:V/A-type H+/Na+-transporting ATPase subunit I
MIVKMKKVWLVCQSKDGSATINQLRKLGVMHIDHQQPPQSKDIAALEEDINVCAGALDVLSRYCQGKEKPLQNPASDWKLTSRHIIDLDKRLDQLREYSCLLKNRILEWELWGDFEPAGILVLAAKHIYLRFYEIPLNEIKSLPEELIVKKISLRGNIANCVIVSREKKDIPWKEIPAPKASLSAMRHRLQQDSLVENALIRDLCKHNDHFEDIRKHRILLEKELKFQKALQGMGKSGGLVYLAGYAPLDAVTMLEEAARAYQWGISIQDPGDEDAVPTLLRQPRWVSVIRPLLDFLGIIPGYRELDVSWTFLIFFSIFFGILIGDAGYGLVYLLLTRFVLRPKLGPKRAKATLLLYILSASAIVWGMLSGSFFGQQWLSGVKVSALVPQLSDAKFFQALCFFLGALHLSIAHGWRTILKLPSLSALADFGWLLIVWAAFFLARTLILDDPFPGFGRPMLYSGIGLVVLFTNPQKNMLKAVGEGLGTIALSLVNSFTDVVSYIRLFAVGMAGVAIADATNAMASSSGNAVAAVVIVSIGHSLNLIMGPMSVLVHGVRLNILEFSGHAGVSWSGETYEPLAE